jgi:hypothetical protein
MSTFFKISVAILFTGLAAGCKSVSKFSIDDHALVKADSGLLGIWKAVEDTDKADYFLVQSPYDLFHHAEWWYNLDSSQRREIFIKRFGEKYMEDTMLGRVAYYKNETMFRESYDDFKRKQGLYYYITRMDSHGENPHYQQFTAFISEIKKTKFLNISYHDENTDGYFFVKLIHISKGYDSITTAIVADTALGNLTSVKDVRSRLEKNMDKKRFYSDTLHLYKVNGYHSDLSGSASRANEAPIK